MDKISFIIDAATIDRRPCFELMQQFSPSTDVVFNEPLDDRIEILVEQDQLHMTAVQGGQVIRITNYDLQEKPLEKERFKGFLYLFLKEIFRRGLAWGMLTGIKPVKIAHQMMVDGCDEDETIHQMMHRRHVSEEKAHLAATLASGEIPVVHPMNPKRVSVYVGIPLCPAKCSYCSFVSTVADKAGCLAADYLANLLLEIKALERLVQEKGLLVDTLYIGGGTPSIFSASQIEQLMTALDGVFIHSGLREFTFEAGRPETTSRDKLEVMKAFGVDRICLNPQSMNEETLHAINRNHTPQDIIDTYKVVRDVGFKTVNMDLIIGLNQESPNMVLHSLDEVIDLAPENLTTHSLAIKKGSQMKESQGHTVQQLYNETFYDALGQRISDAGYHPYYLYRQKYTQGNGENIGYSTPGHAGIYNILMMAERQTIIGIGAGSSGKVYDAQMDRFEKVFTVKDIRTYNRRLDEIIRRKCMDYSAIIADLNVKNKLHI